jgi:hypothetical protein
MVRELELIECMEQCKKLIHTIKEDCDIPSEKFASETAEVLVKIRKEQVSKLEKIYKKLSLL